MWEILAIYFGINLALALILWFALLPHKMSAIGFFLMVFFLGLPILILALCAFALVLMGGATYNFGDILEKFFRGLIKK